MTLRRRFVAYFYFVGWDCISLGAHVCPSLPNIEIHLPFGFVRIGWVKYGGRLAINHEQIERRTFGIDETRGSAA